MLLFISSRPLICCSGQRGPVPTPQDVALLTESSFQKKQIGGNWWQKSWNRKERKPNLTWGFLLSAMSLELDFGASYLWDNRAHIKGSVHDGRGQKNARVPAKWLGFMAASTCPHCNTLKIKEVAQAACKASGQVHYRVHLYYTTTPLSNIHKDPPLQFSVWYRYLLFLLAYCKK